MNKHATSSKNVVSSLPLFRARKSYAIVRFVAVMRGPSATARIVIFDVVVVVVVV